MDIGEHKQVFANDTLSMEAPGNVSNSICAMML